MTGPDLALPRTVAGAPPADLEVLLPDPAPEQPDVRGAAMPAELAGRYGGPLLVPLRPDRPTLIANFVSTLDGIVAFGDGALSGGGPISGFHEPDRFVMALLRAVADAVVVAAGTLRGADAHRWTPDHVHPASRAALAKWRASMGLPEQPTTMIVTASGEIPARHASLNDPTIPVVVATTPHGAARLRGAGLSDHVRVEVVGGNEPLSGDNLLALAGRLGARLVLTEGGPHLLGTFLEGNLLDELFLTLAPQLTGNASDERRSLVEGIALTPADSAWHDLVSVRRSASHLFLRYRRQPGRHHQKES